MADNVTKGFKVVFKVGNKNVQERNDSPTNQTNPVQMNKKPVFVIKTNKTPQETVQPPRKVVFKVPSVPKKEIPEPEDSKKRKNDAFQDPSSIKKIKTHESDEQRFDSLMVNPPLNTYHPVKSEHVIHPQPIVMREPNVVKPQKPVVSQKILVPMDYSSGIPNDQTQWDKPWKYMRPPNFERTPNGYNDLLYFREKQYFNKILSIMTSDKYKESIETFMNDLGDSDVLKYKKESAYNLFKARELEHIELGKGTRPVALTYEDIESLRSLQSELMGKIDLSFLNVYTSDMM